MISLLSPIEQTGIYCIQFICHHISVILQNDLIRTILYLFLIAYIIVYFSGIHHYGEMLYMPFLRKLSIHDYGRKFFDIRVFYANKKTEKICKTLGTSKSKGNYILTPNHHGYLSLATFYGIVTNPKYFGLDRLYVGVHKILMRLPFIWDIFKYYGCFNIEKNNVIRHIERGDDILVIPGGSREMLKCSFDNLDMNFEKRDGILKLAYQYKKPVIPIYLKGANRIFQTRKIPGITDYFMNYCYRYPFPLFVWGPNPTKVRVYVCEPIDPSNYSSYKKFERQYYIDLLTTIKHRESYKIVGSLRQKMMEYGIIDETPHEKRK